MNTDTQHTPANAPEITEADVFEWLRAKTESYGIPGLILKIESPTEWSNCIARLSTDSNAFGCGKTLDIAVGEVRKCMRTPMQLAESKRATARALLAEADKLCAEVAT